MRHSTSTLERVVPTIGQQPRGAEILFPRDSNTDMSTLDGNERGEAIALETETKGLEDIVAHFLSHHFPCTRDGRMWSMLHPVKEVRSWTDYILGMDHRLFQNFAVWDPRHNVDHYLVLGCLHDTTQREHNATSGSAHGSHSALPGSRP